MYSLDAAMTMKLIDRVISTCQLVCHPLTAHVEDLGDGEREAPAALVIIHLGIERVEEPPCVRAKVSASNDFMAGHEPMIGSLNASPGKCPARCRRCSASDVRNRANSRPCCSAAEKVVRRTLLTAISKLFKGERGDEEDEHGREARDEVDARQLEDRPGHAATRRHSARAQHAHGGRAAWQSGLSGWSLRSAMQRSRDGACIAARWPLRVWRRSSNHSAPLWSSARDAAQTAYWPLVGL